ncbi:hypothetical protein GE061_010557 [Apolygus lucorum]|uniref:Protein kinase domain-containing protein n=1 Tax=Apolygus lucorum TaxID=248454 RepID=A0A6A4JWK5_APOLU|nr:hypothetical protein GE061_010557 [Apolygus lucorum]
MNHGSIKESLIKKWSRDLVVALMYLHRMDIAHRDIKCDNILLTAKYNVKLADFGFARYTRDHQGSPLFASTDCGSLNYTAPEVLLGIPYNPKIADIWSLGVVIFIMLNGSFPFVAKDVTSLYREQIARDFKFTQTANKNASSHLLNVIRMLLEPVYHERMTLEDILHSEWIGVPKGLTGLTSLEEAAQSRIHTSMKRS